MNPLNWQTEKRKPSMLVNNEFNPRKITPEQMKKLEESIAKFDLVEIPVIGANNVILAGHQRIAVLIQLGRGEDDIDVRVPNRPLTEAETKEYLLRSNINNGSWDDELLQIMGGDMLELAGFSEMDIARILGEEPKIPDAKFTATTAFTSTPEHQMFIRACLEYAEESEDLIQYGKRARTSDKLLLILNEWAQQKGIKTLVKEM